MSRLPLLERAMSELRRLSKPATDATPEHAPHHPGDGNRGLWFIGRNRLTAQPSRDLFAEVRDHAAHEILHESGARELGQWTLEGVDHVHVHTSAAGRQCFQAIGDV